MFLSDEEREEMDGDDWRLYHYKTKKMDVFAKRGMVCCAWILAMMVPALALMQYDGPSAAFFFFVSSLPFLIPFLKTAWWFFDDREALKKWREAKAKKENLTMNGKG